MTGKLEVERYTVDADSALISLDRRVAEIDTTRRPTERSMECVSQTSELADADDYHSNSTERENEFCYTEDELSAMDGDHAFVVPSSTRLEDLRYEAVQAMKSLAEETFPCCVCELDCDRADICTEDLTATLLAVRLFIY
jgi:hypothetical protein